VKDILVVKLHCLRFCRSVLAAIGIGKLIIMPAIGTGLVLLGLHLNLIRKDPILIFILFLQACTPPASKFKLNDYSILIF
jgi:hypothetical protein